MCRSSTMQPRASLQTSRNACGDENVATLRPADLRRRASACRTSASSSMTKTVDADSCDARLVSIGRQLEVQCGATVGIVRCPCLAAVRFDNGTADRKPEPHSPRLGGHERLEDPLDVLQ